MPDKVEKVNFGQIGPPPTLSSPKGLRAEIFGPKSGFFCPKKKHF